MRRLIACVAVVVTAWTLPASAAEPALPAGGRSVIAPDAFVAAYRKGHESPMGTIAVVPADAPGATEALRVTTTGPVTSAWSFQVMTSNDQPITKGDALYVEAYVRAIKPSPETGEAASCVVLEDAKTFDKSVNLTFGAGREWKHVYEAFESAKNFAPGEAHLIFRAGYPDQAFEIAGVRLLDFGKDVKLSALPSMPFTYAGRAADAAWRKAAEARIEKIRKAPLTIDVVDASGRPVAGAEVHVAMTRNAFRFGAAAAAKLLQPDATGPEVAQYRQTLEDNFNTVTIENNLKWPGWLNDRQQALNALHWLKDHHFHVRGHNLVWPSWRFMPHDLEKKYANNLDPMRQIVLEHIRDEVTAVDGLVDRWDVVNEPVVNHMLMDHFGWGEMAGWYKLVHQLDPSAVLCLNDYNILSAQGRDTAHQAAFEKIIKEMLADGAPVQALGLQAHMGMDVTPPAKVLEILDRYAKLGLPIEITEYDMPGQDEKLQGDYTRDLLIAAYSHPDVVGVTTWSYWEGRRWKPGAALFNQDFTPKPSGQAWHELTRQTWWTDEKMAADAHGAATVRGFLGDYQVSATQGQRTAAATVTLTKDGTHVRVTLK